MFMQKNAVAGATKHMHDFWWVESLPASRFHLDPGHVRVVWDGKGSRQFGMEVSGCSFG